MGRGPHKIIWKTRRCASCKKTSMTDSLTWNQEMLAHLKISIWAMPKEKVPFLGSLPSKLKYLFNTLLLSSGTTAVRFPSATSARNSQPTQTVDYLTQFWSLSSSSSSFNLASENPSHGNCLLMRHLLRPRLSGSFWRKTLFLAFLPPLADNKNWYWVRGEIPTS